MKHLTFQEIALVVSCAGLLAVTGCGAAMRTSGSGGSHGTGGAAGTSATGGAAGTSATGGAAGTAATGGTAGSTVAGRVSYGFVNTGHVLKSDHFRMISTVGSPGAAVGSSASANVHLRSGLIPGTGD